MAWILSDEKDEVAPELGKTGGDRCQQESQELRCEHFKFDNIVRCQSGDATQAVGYIGVWGEV